MLYISIKAHQVENGEYIIQQGLLGSITYQEKKLFSFSGYMMD
jgi:hypothetical protein